MDPFGKRRYNTVGLGVGTRESRCNQDATQNVRCGEHRRGFQTQKEAPRDWMKCVPQEIVTLQLSKSGTEQGFLPDQASIQQGGRAAFLARAPKRLRFLRLRYRSVGRQVVGKMKPRESNIHKFAGMPESHARGHISYISRSCRVCALQTHQKPPANYGSSELR